MRKNIPLTCPKCHNNARQDIIDTQQQNDTVWRKRRCAGCEYTYKTREGIGAARSNAVVVRAVRAAFSSTCPYSREQLKFAQRDSMWANTVLAVADALEDLGVDADKLRRLLPADGRRT